MNISDRLGGPGRRITALTNIFIVFALEIRKIRLLEVFGGVLPGKREKHFVNKRNRRRRTFDVQQNAAAGHD